MNISETLNLAYIESQYQLWQTRPEELSRDWQFFFNGFEQGLGHTPEALTEALPDAQAASRSVEGRKQAQVEHLIFRYRNLGHLLSCTDPLSTCPTSHPLLDLEAVGLTPDDLKQPFHAPPHFGSETAPLQDIIAQLKAIYCRAVGVEYMHLQDPDELTWLQERLESPAQQTSLTAAEKQRLLEKLTQAALFEQFLNKKYAGVTRFSLEGGDVLIPLLDALLERFSHSGGREIVLGMAHRGRLNVLAHILEKPYHEIFAEFEHCYDPDNLVGAGDVKYHNGYLTDIQTFSGKPLRIYLVNNPSHLESVNAVVEGLARARQDLLEGDRRNAESRRQVLPLLIHGDAAFAGQGVVAEVLNMSQLQGYRTGGTIHLVINNQIGYTTLPTDARSTRYATDVAKMLLAPVFHVHGEDPEAAIHTIRLAADYRRQFAKDVVIDLICYRRYGHNEGDEPYFTQPLMYDRIRQRQPLNKLYGQELSVQEIVDEKALAALQAPIEERLNADYDSIHGTACAFPMPRFYPNWEGYHGRYTHDPVPTGVALEKLKQLAQALNQLPETFSPSPKIKALLAKRLEAVNTGVGLDWANAESLGWASLLAEKVPIRLSGQDSGRGTFSQRHSVLVDTRTGDYYTPLNHLVPINDKEGQARYEVINSLLNEAGVLGFEYGYAMARPDALVMWEAQFGDFINNAQSVIDLYLVSGETKWQRLNGLVLLLPHGYEGMGPEHSSARFERFLQLCADDNIQVCYPTTPAQYFHLLRRQMRRPLRKPLVVLTPKSLLRHPAAVSTLAQLADEMFYEVLPDNQADTDTSTLLLCSGKIYYDLIKRRKELKQATPAIIRLEQLYPFPAEQLKTIIDNYPRAQKFVWLQEEPENMGAWWFIQQHLRKLLPEMPEFVGRPVTASPATGFPAIYKKQQADILGAALPEKAS